MTNTYLRPTLFLLGWLALSIQAAELVKIKDVTLLDASLNDGDSFQVNAGGRKLHLRLYYVDCLETAAHYGTAGITRIREQQRHFGLEDLPAVVGFGEQATNYTQELLSQPFSIYTSYANAPGSSSAGRFYAFVETHAGQDLGKLLVAQGLARIHGKTRPAPDGTPSETVLAELQDLRATAMLKRAGIWSATNPELLTRLRKQQREDNQEIKTLAASLSKTRRPNDSPLDLNSASNRQLQNIPRIGPVTAAKIIAGRPYQSVQELLKIPSIGPKTLEAITPYVTVTAE